MYRAVLAVLLAAALLAVSQPAIQQGRQERAGTLLDEEVETLLAEAEDLVRTDEAVDGPGARRIVTVELPSTRRFSAGAEYVEIGGGETPVLEWAVEGNEPRRSVVEGFGIRTPDEDPLRLERAGTHRLRLGLSGPPGDPIVVVTRFEQPGEVSSDG